MTDIVERLRKQAWQRSGAPKMGAGHTKMLEWEAADEIKWLHATVLDACNVFEHYDLPEHAFHYRRAILGLDKAKQMARQKPAATGRQP